MNTGAIGLVWKDRWVTNFFTFPQFLVNFKEKNPTYKTDRRDSSGVQLRE